MSWKAAIRFSLWLRLWRVEVFLHGSFRNLRSWANSLCLMEILLSITSWLPNEYAHIGCENYFIKMTLPSIKAKSNIELNISTLCLSLPLKSLCFSVTILSYRLESKVVLAAEWIESSTTCAKLQLMYISVKKKKKPKQFMCLHYLSYCFFLGLMLIYFLSFCTHLNVK